MDRCSSSGGPQGKLAAVVHGEGVVGEEEEEGIRGGERSPGL